MLNNLYGSRLVRLTRHCGEIRPAFPTELPGLHPVAGRYLQGREVSEYVAITLIYSRTRLSNGVFVC